VTYRVVQWASGAVGKTCLRAVLDHPDMTLAGLYVYSPRKAGQDAGTIARYPETGIIATRDIGEILGLDADVVIHTARLQLPYTQHDDDICALLRSGKNVITTAGHHYPAAHGPARLAMFDQAARAGGRRGQRDPGRRRRAARCLHTAGLRPVHAALAARELAPGGGVGIIVQDHTRIKGLVTRDHLLPGYPQAGGAISWRGSMRSG